MSLANVNVRVGADIRDFSSKMQNVSRQMKKTGKQMQSVGRSMTTFITAPLAALGAVGVRNWDKQAKAIAQVEAGLRSTGGTVGYTSDQLQKMATELQNNTLFGDEEILKDATAQLLTFTNIAGDQFARTQAVALDLATRLDGDLKSASIQLGKALNDPVANLSALSRSGIQFSDDQEKLIKSLWRTGQQAEAQRVILSELEKQYGGSAAAAAEAGAGGLKQLSNSLGDLTEEFGKIIMEAIQPLVRHVQEAVKWFQGLSDQTKRVIVVVSGLVAAIGPLLATLGFIVSTILPAMAAGFAALTGPVGIAIGAIAALAATIMYVWDNWEAIQERISDLTWWRNTMIDFAKILTKYSSLAFQTLLDGFAFVLEQVGIEVNTDFTTPMLKALDSLKAPTKEYEHQFGSLGDAIKNAAIKGMESLGMLKQKAKEAANETKKATSNISQGGGSFAPTIDAPSLSTEGLQEDPLRPDVLQGKTENLATALENVKGRVVDASSAISGAIQGAASDFLVGIGKMIGATIAGEKGFEGFGHTILKMLGGLAVKVGEIMIGIGTAGIALKGAIANPFAAIAAGVTLVALGSALNAAIQNAGKGGASGGSPGGGSASGPQIRDIDARKLETNVTGEFKLQGYDLVATVEKNQRRQSKTL